MNLYFLRRLTAADVEVAFNPTHSPNVELDAQHPLLVCDIFLMIPNNCLSFSFRYG